VIDLLGRKDFQARIWRTGGLVILSNAVVILVKHEWEEPQEVGDVDQQW
jgi:hypothetical protein